LSALHAAPARPAAHAPRAATPPPRRAWLRIFVVRCSLPCDPPVGGHSCNGGIIPRFHRVVVEALLGPAAHTSRQVRVTRRGCYPWRRTGETLRLKTVVRQ